MMFRCKQELALAEDLLVSAKTCLSDRRYHNHRTFLPKVISRTILLHFFSLPCVPTSSQPMPRKLQASRQRAYVPFLLQPSFQESTIRSSRCSADTSCDAKEVTPRAGILTTPSYTTLCFLSNPSEYSAFGECCLQFSWYLLLFWASHPLTDTKYGASAPTCPSAARHPPSHCWLSRCHTLADKSIKIIMVLPVGKHLIGINSTKWAHLLCFPRGNLRDHRWSTKIWRNTTD